MNGARPQDLPRVARPLECPECGQPGHLDWDCGNAFAVLRTYDRAERVRAALRAACRHGERLARCLAVACRNKAYAIRNPAPGLRRWGPDVTGLPGVSGSRSHPLTSAG